MNPEVGTVASSQVTLPNRDHETVAREALAMASQREYDQVFGMTSGGQDSLTAVDIVHRWGEEYGIEIDAVVHVNTGAGLPTTRETVMEFCAERGLRYIEGINLTDGEAIAHRAHEHGMPSNSRGGPGSAGHMMEFINRKERVFDAVYAGFPGDHLWISGAWANESDPRSVHMSDAPVDFGETGERKPRLSWLSPCHGWVARHFETYREAYAIPETIAYDVVGFSGDCTACAFDDPRVVNEIEILSPELAYSLRSLVVWLFQRWRHGEVDWPLHRCVWGWDPSVEGDDTPDVPAGEHPDQRTFEMAGCASCSKSCYANEPAVPDGGRNWPGAGQGGDG